jgi:hypothetical protein
MYSEARVRVPEHPGGTLGSLRAGLTPADSNHDQTQRCRRLAAGDTGGWTASVGGGATSAA